MSEEKLFGMPAEKGRWLFVVLGFIINICLGSVYAYSVFRGPVSKLLNMSATEAGMPFMVFLALFAIMVFFGGLLLAKLGPKMLGWLGGVVVGVGWILASFSTSGTMLTITYGLIGGGGVGLAYGVPLAVAGRWFPDKRGLALGLTLAGFGGSPFVSANVASALIKAVGPMSTFFYMGVAFLVIILVCFIPYRFPKDGWLPEGWKPPAAAAASAVVFLGELDGGLQSLVAPFVVPIIFQPAFLIVKKGNVFVARPGDAANTDLIDHVDIARRLAAGTTDVEGGGHTAFQYVNNRKPLADIDIF